MTSLSSTSSSFVTSSGFSEMIAAFKELNTAGKNVELTQTDVSISGDIEVFGAKVSLSVKHAAVRNVSTAAAYTIVNASSTTDAESLSTMHSLKDITKTVETALSNLPKHLGLLASSSSSSSSSSSQVNEQKAEKNEEKTKQ